MRHQMGKIIAFLGKHSQKGRTYPTIIHGNIIPNAENTVNRIEKLKIQLLIIVCFVHYYPDPTYALLCVYTKFIFRI